MKHREATKSEMEEIEAMRGKPCYVKGCTQPVFGGRTTDDGLQLNFCEWHFAEDFMAQVEEEHKEEAMDELANLLMIIDRKSQKSQSRLWN